MNKEKSKPAELTAEEKANLEALLEKQKAVEKSKQEAFLKEYQLLCKKHGFELIPQTVLMCNPII